MELTNYECFVLGVLYASEKYNAVRNDKSIGKISCGDVADFLYMESHELADEDIARNIHMLQNKYFGNAWTLTKEIEMSNLPYNFNILYDIKTKEELEQEVEYLVERLRGIKSLCKEDFIEIAKYIDTVIGD